MPAETKEKPLDKSVLSSFDFTIEADTRRNGDILLKSIPGQRLRGAIRADKTTIASTKQNVDDFQPMVPADQVRGLSQLPNLPGQRLSVNTKDGTYRVFDPLRDDTALCERLVSGLKQRGHSVQRINGVKPLEGTLDVHSMKTLCREIRCLVESGDAKVIQGDLPSQEDIDKMKGRYLLNAGALTDTTQPRYEDEYEEWKQNLSKVGG